MSGDNFAFDGNLEKMKTKIMEYTTNAMDWASLHGHLEVVKYLMRSGALEHGKECTEDAMDFASYHGRLEFVKYLHEHGKNVYNICYGYGIYEWSS